MRFQQRPQPRRQQARTNELPKIRHGLRQIQLLKCPNCGNMFHADFTPDALEKMAAGMISQGYKVCRCRN